MSLGTFAYGNYAMTYDGTSVGICVTGSKKLKPKIYSKAVKNTDPYGQSTITKIYQGADWTLSVIFKEWTATVRKAMFPFGVAASPALDLKMGLIGRTHDSIAKQIVLTAESGSLAATNGPTPITLPLCCISDENDFEILLGADERDLPVKFDIFPYDSSGTIIWGTLTNPT